MWRTALILPMLLLVACSWHSASAGRRFRKGVTQTLSDIEDKMVAIKNQMDKMANLPGQLKDLSKEVGNVPTNVADDLEDQLQDVKDKIDDKCSRQEHMKNGLAKMTRDDEGYYLAFRLTAGIGKKSYHKYIQTGVNDDENSVVFDSTPCGCRSVNSSMYCDRHYRSMLLDLWPRIPVDKVKVAVYDKGELKAKFIFNGKGSDHLNFFGQDRVEANPYTDLKSASPNYFSIFGHALSTGTGGSDRRFFMNNNYGGCTSDAGWLMVGEGKAPAACGWEDRYLAKSPFILYSGTSNMVRWESQEGDVMEADVLTVSIKLSGDKQCQ